MEETKLQRLHDTLKKLAPKGNHGGLGSASLVKGGFQHKENGLPKNGLYSYFVKPGHFRKTFDDSDDDDDRNGNVNDGDAVAEKAARKLKRRQEKETKKAKKKREREKFDNSDDNDDRNGNVNNDGAAAEKAARKLKRRQEKETKKAKKKREGGGKAATSKGKYLGGGGGGQGEGGEGGIAAKNNGVRRKRKSSTAPSSGSAVTGSDNTESNGTTNTTGVKRPSVAEDDDRTEDGEGGEQPDPSREKQPKGGGSSRTASGDGVDVGEAEDEAGQSETRKKACRKLTGKVQDKSAGHGSDDTASRAKKMKNKKGSLVEGKIAKNKKKNKKNNAGKDGCGRKREGVGGEENGIVSRSKGEGKKKKYAAPLSSPSPANGVTSESNGAAPGKAAGRVRSRVAARGDNHGKGDSGDEAPGPNRRRKHKGREGEDGGSTTVSDADAESAAAVDDASDLDAGKRASRKGKGIMQDASERVKIRKGEEEDDESENRKVNKKRKKRNNASVDAEGGVGASPDTGKDRKRPETIKTAVGEGDDQEKRLRLFSASHGEHQTRKSEGKKKKKDKRRRGVPDEQGREGSEPKDCDPAAGRRKKRGPVENETIDEAVPPATGSEEASMEVRRKLKKIKKATTAGKARGLKDEGGIIIKKKKNA